MPAPIMPSAGQIEAFRRFLYAGPEDLSVRLFKNDYTPIAASVTGDFTVADFTGYSSQTLTASQSASTWAVPAVSSGRAYSIYGATPILWQAASDQTIYGWYLVGITSGVCYLAQRYDEPQELLAASSNAISFTPKLTFRGL